MTINITTKKLVVTDDYTKRVEKKLKKLDRFFDDAIATVKLSQAKELITVELTLHHKSLMFRAESTNKDRDIALDECVDNIIRKIRKNKTKLEKRIHCATPENFEYDFDEEMELNHEVVKNKKISVKPMLVEEAILQMEMLGHQFFMFRDAEINEICVVYRRNDGKYALLEPSE